MKKENDILKRHLKVSEKSIKTKKTERFILSVLCSISGRVEKYLCIVKPETLLKWQRSFIKKQWTFKRKKSGRPALTNQMKQLILHRKWSGRNFATVRALSILKYNQKTLGGTYYKKIV